jgi:plastocyanin
MMPNKLTIFIILLAILVVAFLFLRNRTIAPTNLETLGVGEVIDNNSQESLDPDSIPLATSTNPVSTSSSSTDSPSLAPKNEVRQFVIEATNFSFSPKIMKVKLGDTVRVTLKNNLGSHDFKIDEFKASTKVISAGKEETIEFVANKTGAFEFYCSVGNHRALGMTGTLTIE